MSIEEKIKKIVEDDIVARNFIETWHIISEILDSFSKATELPISIFFHGDVIFNSPISSMPKFCQKLLNHTEWARQCEQNALDRVKEEIGNKGKKNRNVQVCHAGMMNAKREIKTGIGTLTILFGYKPGLSRESLEKRDGFIEKVRQIESKFADDLSALQSENNLSQKITSAANESRSEPDIFGEHDITLIDSITKILELLLNVTVNFRSLTINMAHELVVMLVGISLMSQETSETLSSLQNSAVPDENLTETINLQKYIDAETKFGLYMVRNYLSQSSEHRYSQVAKPHFERLNLKPLIYEMRDIYQWRATEKDIEILCELDNLPDILGDRMELRRALHNIFSNAIKYSYHSIDERQRKIKINSKNPYDPGFRLPRFAILFENYGLGLEDDEVRQAFNPSFRGKQAIREVAIGSGIGLSEVRKIMTLHKGEVKFQSRKLYGEGIESTYLTTVSLIFPYLGRY